ncbi:hypothetical protein AGOR_G00183020 [Albula goreensis]|uniref:Uncharacterized protein n=1 Tax=Albula goreensis TaxID=1534307 RepID=A0A8T3CSS8_9TELE|nr:hypothetical protein AGOR_G00183020 [Albula goreensis]
MELEGCSLSTCTRQLLVVALLLWSAVCGKANGGKSLTAVSEGSPKPCPTILQPHGDPFLMRGQEQPGQGRTPAQLEELRTAFSAVYLLRTGVICMGISTAE